MYLKPHPDTDSDCQLIKNFSVTTENKENVIMWHSDMDLSILLNNRTQKSGRQCLICYFANNIV